MFSTLGLAIATMPTFNCAIHTKEGIHTPHTFVGVQKRARAVSTGSCDRSKVTHGPKPLVQMRSPAEKDYFPQLVLISPC